MASVQTVRVCDWKAPGSKAGTFFMQLLYLDKKSDKRGARNTTGPRKVVSKLLVAYTHERKCILIEDTLFTWRSAELW
jgi:hypothetical protein